MPAKPDPIMKTGTQLREQRALVKLYTDMLEIAQQRVDKLQGELDLHEQELEELRAIDKEQRAARKAAKESNG